MAPVTRHRLYLFALLAASAALTSARVASAQRRPFPQHTGYPHGFVPTNITDDDALVSYDLWKDKYLTTDCGHGYYRVKFDSPKETTVSEGMGYGMVLTAYFGDRAVFDGLWKFVEKNLNPEGLMGWKVTCGGFVQDVGGDGCATDGDTDIGFALVAAVDQWGEAYRQTALDYLAVLKKIDFESCPRTHRVIAKPGNWGGGCDASNTSYWMPGYYRVFQEFTGDAFWGEAADDAVALYLLNRDPRTGLLGTDVDELGVAINHETYVDYNGCRTPWRAVLDYLWYGTPGIRNVTDKMTDWVQTFGISRLVDGYNTDGIPTAAGRYTQQNSWVGGFTCGAMSKSQEVVNAFAADLKSISPDEGGYYGSSLRSLYLLMLSGNFWKPGAATSPWGDAGAKSARPPPGAPAEDGRAVDAADKSPPPSQATGVIASGPPPHGCGGCGCGSGSASSAFGGAFGALLLLSTRRRGTARRHGRERRR